MNQNQTSNNIENTQNTNKSPVSSPFSQRNLVSKVNALAANSANNSLVNPQSIVFNNEKGSTLNYKFLNLLKSIIQVNFIIKFIQLFCKVLIQNSWQ